MPQPPINLIPPPKAFLESLLTTLTSTKNSETATTPKLCPTSRSTFLTLHALFPTLLLPALDLLDRRLLTRFIITSSRDPAAHNANIARNPTPAGENESERTDTAEPRKSQAGPQRIVYYAQSTAHATRSRYSSRHAVDAASTYYEVRPLAWSCTCAAFTFAAYNNNSTAFSPVFSSWEDGSNASGNREEDEEMLDVLPSSGPDAEGKGGPKIGWWGGLMRLEGEVPLCKHLLACLLAERWDVAREMVEEREVGREEGAGWAAGWGG